MLIAYDKETLDVIFVHPSATEMTGELLDIVGDRDYGTILSDVPFNEYAKPGSTHRLVEVGGVVTFEFTPAQGDPPEPAPEKTDVETLGEQLVQRELEALELKAENQMLGAQIVQREIEALDLKSENQMLGGQIVSLELRILSLEGGEGA